MEIKKLEYRFIIDIIKKHSGLHIAKEKSYLIPSKLNTILEEYHLKNYTELGKELEKNINKEIFFKTLDLIINHETSFFREKNIFQSIHKQIIPEWLFLNNLNKNYLPKDKKFKIWSAGCSTGQESISVLIAILEKYPNFINHIEILATDISPYVIEYAKKGKYSEFQIDRGLDKKNLKSYFIKINKGYQIKNLYKKLINYQTLNLVNSRYPTQFDLILCRNVVFYFDQKTRLKTYNSLFKSLNPKGILYLGLAEDLSYYKIKNLTTKHYNQSKYFQFSKKSVFC